MILMCFFFVYFDGVTNQQTSHLEAHPTDPLAVTGFFFLPATHWLTSLTHNDSKNAYAYAYIYIFIFISVSYSAWVCVAICFVAVVDV